MLTRSFRHSRLLTPALVIVGVLLAAILTPLRAEGHVLLGARVTIVSVGNAVPDTPGAREWLVDAGEGVNVVVRSSDLLFRPAPLHLFLNRTLRLTTSGPDSATFSYTKVLPAGQSQVTFTGVTWNTAFDDVDVKVEVIGGGVLPDTSNGSVLGESATVPANTEAWNFNGGSPNIGTENCTVNSDVGTCAGLRAKSTTRQLLGLADCNPATDDNCILGGPQVVTFLTGLHSSTDRFNPNKLRIEVDDSLVDNSDGECDYYDYDGGDGGGYYCYPVLDGEGGGEGGGLIDPNDFVLRIQLVPGGPWHTPPLCFEYGIVDAGLNDCVGSMFVEENGNITIDFFYLEDGRGLVK